MSVTGCTPRNLAYGITIACAVVTLTSLTGCEKVSNFDECVIDGMKGVSSDVAARSIRLACLSSFPPGKEGSKNAELLTIPESAMGNLNSKARYWTMKAFVGDELWDGAVFGIKVQVDNENSDWRIYDIDVETTWVRDGEETTRRQRERFMAGLDDESFVGPYSTGYVNFPHGLGQGKKVELKSWRIVSARGQKE